MPRAAAVLEGENEDREENRDGHEHRERDQKQVQRVYGARLSGSGRRPEWKVLKHSFLLNPVYTFRCFGPEPMRNITRIKLPKTKTVMPPAICNTRLMIAL